MADIRIKDLPLGTPAATKLLPMDFSTTERASIRDIVFAGRPAASQAEAEAGTNSEKVMTPLTTKQSIASEVGDTIASAAQGALASTAVQPEDLSLVATTGLYTDLIGRPEIGSDVVFDVVEGVTSVSISYVPGTLRSVYRNGVRQTEWAATDGLTVTFPIVTSADIGDDGFCEIIVCIGENVGGSTAFNDGRYFLRTEAGRDVGDLVRYEDTDGAGLPTIRTSERIIFSKEVATSGDPYQFGFIRDANFSDGTYGTVNANVAMYLSVKQTTPNFQWNFLTSTTVEQDVGGPGGGEHVNAYFQALKFGDSQLWGMCLEFRDRTINPTTGSVGMEFGYFVNGADNNKLRHALDFSFGGFDNELGDNVISTGIRMGASFAQPGRMVMRKGVDIAGRVYEGIDLSNISPAFSVSGMGSGGDRALVMNPVGKLVWRDGRYGNPAGPLPDVAAFGWVPEKGTFLFSGPPVTIGTATADRKIKLNFNGVDIYINASLA